tara:strand:+ start:767 stop:1696 length:930 start_codon:yes stop_codon:yes gene_type:complete
MFHHFHDDNIHKKGQGSIDKKQLSSLIKFIGRENILDASEFYNRFLEKKLNSKNVCLTFDDGIRCQYDVALPVLEDFKIKSFFFVYSSLFEGEPDLLELYRYFRMNYFKNINDFYENFYENVNHDLKIFFSKNIENINKTKKKFEHYTINDIKFRLVRDHLLNKETYKNIMLEMFKNKKFDYKEFFEILFLNKNHLIKIDKLGHLIGLHSHDHPALMEKLSYENQYNQYKRNINILSKILKKDINQINCMSHPSGSYNKNTLEVLEKIGIKLGFKQIMTIEPEKGMKKINNSNLEIARQDHADIMKMIN